VSNRPARRLSLTQPTAPLAAPESASGEIGALPAETPLPTAPAASGAGSSTAALNVMVYLDPDEAEALDELWVSLRRHPRKPSKSDLLRAGLLALLADPESLDSALSRLRTSTQARKDANRKR
jgi:hypothetical protein